MWRNDYAPLCRSSVVPKRSQRLRPSPGPLSSSNASPRPGASPGVSICRLHVPLPESTWIAKFSRTYPEVEIEVLSRLDLGRTRSLTEIRLHSDGTNLPADELRGLSQVDEVEELEGGPTEVHLRVIHRTSEFVPIFRDLRLMRRFPFSIRAGAASWVVVASKARLQQLLSRLRERVPSATLESVRHADTAGPFGLLTPRQGDLLRRAMAAGYFEVPRKITLTALAERFDLAPSSLSEALAIVEKKLLEQWPSSAALESDPSAAGGGRFATRAR